MSKEITRWFRDVRICQTDASSSITYRATCLGIHLVWMGNVAKNCQEILMSRRQRDRAYCGPTG
jgi:hypothetical protein